MCVRTHMCMRESCAYKFRNEPNCEAHVSLHKSLEETKRARCVKAVNNQQPALLLACASPPCAAAQNTCTHAHLAAHVVVALPRDVPLLQLGQYLCSHRHRHSHVSPLCMSCWCTAGGSQAVCEEEKWPRLTFLGAEDHTQMNMQTRTRTPAHVHMHTRMCTHRWAGPGTASAGSGCPTAGGSPSCTAPAPCL